MSLKQSRVFRIRDLYDAPPAVSGNGGRPLMLNSAEESFIFGPRCGSIEWTAVRPYAIGDIIFRAGMLFRCVSVHTNQDPLADSAETYWTDLILAPIGSPVPLFRDTVPPFCLALDGSVVTVAAYPYLYAAIGKCVPRRVQEVPLMTDFNAPAGQVWESGDAGAGYEGWRCFSQTTAFWQGATPAWVAYQFPTAKTLREIAVKAYYDTGYGASAPGDFTVKGSNDTTDGSDGTWTTLLTKIGQIFSDGETKRYDLTVTGSYRTYKLTVTATQASLGYVAIDELSLSGVQFTLPDLRDQFVRGINSAGRVVGDIQGDMILRHDHSVYGYNGSYGGSALYFVPGYNGTSRSDGTTVGVLTTNNGVGAFIDSARLGAENRPQNISALIVARYM